MNRFKLFIPLIIFFLLGLLFLVGLRLDPNDLPSELIDKPVPAFSLPTLAGEGEVMTAEQLKGKPYLLNIWATWCPACRHEHPYLLKLAEQGIPIYGINYKDDTDAARVLLQKTGDPYVANIVDKEGILGLDLGVTGAPETFLVDAAGIIRYRLVGVLDEEIWTSTLAPIFFGGQG